MIILAIVGILTIINIFTLIQIKLIWNEFEARKNNNKEIGEILDLHSEWLNHLKDEVRTYARLTR